MDVRLKDSSGRTIDYVQVGPGAGDSRIPDSSCDAGELPYDSDVPPVSGQAGKFAKRLPDGTGNWSMDTGASDGKSTKSTTNDNDATGPLINVYGDGVFAGGSVVFRIALPSGEVASEDIQIQYETEDNTATAPEDYSMRSGTATIYAGANSVDIPVSTVKDSTQSQNAFTCVLPMFPTGFPHL
jgi:hypothetical protein